MQTVAQRWLKGTRAPKALSVSELAAAYQEDRFKAWKPDQAHAAAYLARSRCPDFETAAPRAMEAPDRDTFLWRFCMLAFEKAGIRWRPQYQKRGTCVGQGYKLGGDTVLAKHAVLFGKKFPGRCAVAGTYPGGRVDVAGQPGSWDGSNGSWTIEWVLKWGLLLLNGVGLTEDSRDEDERLALRWCASRQGVPAAEETLAKKRPIRYGPRVRQARECAKILQAGNPVVECSNLIASGRRDRNGFSPVSRSGGHCQLVWAVRFNPMGFLIQNSWSEDWGSGPKWPDDQPDGSVWVDEGEMQAILNQGDTYAMIDAGGLEPLDDDPYSVLL